MRPGIRVRQDRRRCAGGRESLGASLKKAALPGLLALALAPGAPGQVPQGTAFTYQGQLQDGGAPASGAYDFQLILYDAAVGGSQVGPIVMLENVVVTGGLFTVALDFGTAFGGSKRWLDIGVRPGASGGLFTPLAPRQELSAAPAAQWSAAAPWAGVAGKPAGFADDTDNDTLGGLVCNNNQIAKRIAGAWACAADANSGGTVTQVASGSGLTGGPITTSGTLAVSFAGSGGAGTVARSDHDHLAQSWTGASFTGLQVASTAVGGIGIQGQAEEATGSGRGVAGLSSAASGAGVFGEALSTTGANAGVRGEASSPSGYGVYGIGLSTTGSAVGVRAVTNSSQGYGVYANAAAATGTNYAIFAQALSTSGYAGYFSGRVNVSGTLTKSAGSFRIDHPLDPEHKYLSHSFVESPDMKNVYDGVVTTDGEGFAAVLMPDWFEALNRDFRYQLTVLGDGAWARARIFRKLANNAFVIQTDLPGVEVSWQVTGIRQDPYAEKHRVLVEEDKPEDERGTYLEPEARGLPVELGLDHRRHRAIAGVKGSGE